MAEQQLRIVYRRYGIADRFNDGTIELHEGLNNYPQLKKSIIMHEIRHTSNPRFNSKDFLHDVASPDKVKFGQMLRFMFKNPSSLVQFLPVYYTKKRGWIIDHNLFVIYGFFALLAAIAAGLAFSL